MLDTLDLVQIRQEAATQKRNARRRWKVLAAIMVFLICSFPTLVIASVYQDDSYRDSDSKCSERSLCLVATQICGITPMVGFIGFGVVFLWNQRRQQKKLHELNLELPKVSYPFATPLNIITVLWSVFWVGIASVIPALSSAIFLVVLLPLALVGFINWKIRDSLYRGRYDETLHWGEIFRRWLGIGNDMGLVCIEALALLQAGRAEASEKKHLEFLAQTKRARLSEPTALNNLGCEFMLQGRYAEAALLLENAILMQPTLGPAYDSLASVYLESGSDPQRALELSEMAVAYAPRGMSRALILANFARALALTGYAPRAESTLQEAFKKANKKQSLWMSELHRLAGHTMQALGNRDAAREHFTAAVQLNPHGRTGHMAQRAIDQM